VNQTMQHDFVGSPVAQDYGKVIGTPFKVFLSNGVEEKLDKTTGKVMTDIIDLPGLIAAILRSRVLHPRKLSGNDLKFIRSALHMRSVDVAAVLDITPEHYSRCEAGTKTLSASGERHYRMHVYLESLFKHAVVQEHLSRNQEAKDIDSTDLEKAKETLEAFRKIFSEMKIQHIFDAEDELSFSFCRGPSRRAGEKDADCGKDDGKWQKQKEHLEAA